MLDHSAAYDQAVVARSRRQFVMAIFDLVDPDAVITAGDSNDQSARLSRPDQIANRGATEAEKLTATLERNRWLLDGSRAIAPDDPLDQTGQIGWVSDSLSDENGLFAVPPYIELDIENVEILQAVSFLFSSQPFNGYPVDFTVQIYSGATLLHEEAVEGNRTNLLVIDDFTVDYPTRLRLTIERWSECRRRVRVPRIMLGLYESWGTDIIQAVDIYTEVTFSGLNIPYSTCTLVVENENHRFDPYAPNSLFGSIEDRQAIPIQLGLRLADGTTEWLPAGTYYQQSGGWSLQDLTVTWELLDIVGMLVKRKFVVPAILPTTLSGWLEAILVSLGGNFADRFIVDDDVADTPMTATEDAVKGRMCGELLRFACMATQTWPRQDFATGKLRVGKLIRTEGNRITLDNMAEPPRMQANDDVADLTFQLDEGEVTFAGSNTESEVSLSVDNPFIHTIDDAKTAYVSCMFEYGGKSFRVIHRGNPSTECGDIQSVDTQFQTTISARLYKQQLALQDGVMTRMPSYLVQTSNDSLYANKVVLTGSGNWTAPVATTIRVTVISGGNGGMGGGGGVWRSTGEGNFSIFDPPDTEGSAGGPGGKVFIIELPVTQGQVFSYACGAGGAGGAGGARFRNGEPGTEGEHTTFGVADSANGRVYANGIMDVQTGTVYAQKGPDYGQASSGSYGSGGIGGRAGENGIRYYYKASEDDIGYREKTKRDCEPGEAGGQGQPGCVILEW